MNTIVQDFIQSVAQGQTEIYNEFSLQHELGIHLRKHFPEMKVRFERNVSSLFDSASHFKKKEIDICVCSQDGFQKHSAFELKFPRNGQHPEQMFSFCKDISFLEQLKQAGFLRTYFLAFVDDRLFYEGAAKGIYAYFRAGHPLTGTIQKPTGKKDDVVVISGCYTITWQSVGNGLKYAFVEMQDQPTT
jgi:hypothetical protein